jgi:hypothetical protein
LAKPKPPLLSLGKTMQNQNHPSHCWQNRAKPKPALPTIVPFGGNPRTWPAATLKDAWFSEASWDQVVADIHNGIHGGYAPHKTQIGPIWHELKQLVLKIFSTWHMQRVWLQLRLQQVLLHQHYSFRFMNLLILPTPKKDVAL